MACSFTCDSNITELFCFIVFDRHMYSNSVLSIYECMCMCLDVWRYAFKYMCPAIKTHDRFRQLTFNSWLPPFSEIKSLFSQAAYWVKASKQRCSGRVTDNKCLKDHLRLHAYIIKGLCVGPDLIYQRRSTWQSILHWVTVDFLWTNATSLQADARGELSLYKTLDCCLGSSFGSPPGRKYSFMFYLTVVNLSVSHSYSSFCSLLLFKAKEGDTKEKCKLKLPVHETHLSESKLLFLIKMTTAVCFSLYSHCIRWHLSPWFPSNKSRNEPEDKFQVLTSD